MKLQHIFRDAKVEDLFKLDKVPQNVMLDVTEVCNNKCLYCYNEDVPAHMKKHQDINILCEIISRIGNAGTQEVLYLGGEPFSHPKIETLLSKSASVGMFQRAVSNGFYLRNLKKCKIYKSLGLSEVGVSFHSSRAEVHDYITGRNGSFENALAAVQSCLEAGIETFIQYSPNTQNEVDDILLLAADMHERFPGVNFVFDINRLLPTGAGGDYSHLFLANNDWFQLLVQAVKLEKFNFSSRAELTPFCMLKAQARQFNCPNSLLEKIFAMNRGCFMWIAQLPLDCKGRIKFCPAGPAVGPSILEESWPELWLEWDEFQKYRKFDWNHKCLDIKRQSRCDYFFRCMGGCKYSCGGPYQRDIYAVDNPSKLHRPFCMSSSI